MLDRSETDPGDLLSEMLEKLRFQGDPGVHGCYTAPWGLEFAAQPGQAPFYVVAAGSCWLEMEGEEPRQLYVGDLVLLPRGDAHILRDAPRSRTVAASEVVPPPDRRIVTVNWGGGGGETHLLGGFFRFDSSFSLPLLGALERVILLRAEDPQRANGVDPLLGLFCHEGRSQEPGNRAATSGLLKLLFIQILRITLSARGPHGKRCEPNPLVLLFDPVLRRAAEAIHFESHRPWTIAGLAALAGMSRTTFAVRFQELTGTSPLAYLTQVRMLNAVDRLERTNDTLEAIARQVGYGSEAAFSTAFKRELGVSPGAYRRERSVRKISA